MTPWEGRRRPRDGSQAAGWAQSKSPAARRPPDGPRNVFSACLFSLKKKNGFTFMLCFPHPGCMGALGRGRGHCIKKCFIRRSKFCTTGLHLLFCIVYVCGFPPPPKLYFSSHTAPPPRPCFSLLCRGGERKMCVGFLEETKQHKTKNNLCILDETKPNGR